MSFKYDVTVLFVLKSVDISYFVNIFFFFFRMTILSSREHTCIQTPWRGHSFRNKTEMCCALLDPVEVHKITSYNSKYCSWNSQGFLLMLETMC
jgi:hypothetical protein